MTKTLLNVGTNTAQTKCGDCLRGELERVIEKEKPSVEIVPAENNLFSLPKVLAILDDEDFKIKQETKNKKMTR